MEVFALLREPELTPRFNIALTSQAAGVRQVDKHRESMMRRGADPFLRPRPQGQLQHDQRPRSDRRQEADFPRVIRQTAVSERAELLRVAPETAGRRGTAQIRARAELWHLVPDSPE